MLFRRVLAPVAAAGALAVTGAGIAQAAPATEAAVGSFSCENDTYTATYGGLRSSGPIDCSELAKHLTPGAAQPGPAVSGSDIAGTTAPADAPTGSAADAPADSDDEAAQPVG